MQNISCLILALALSTSFVHSQSISNPGFETGDLSSWKFTNPAPAGQAKEKGYTASVIKDIPGNGSLAAQLTITGYGTWAQLGQRLPFSSRDSLDARRLTARIKLADRAAGSAGISVRMLQGTKSIGYFEKSIGADTGWTTVTVDFLANNRVDSLAVFCGMQGYLLPMRKNRPTVMLPSAMY